MARDFVVAVNMCFALTCFTHWQQKAQEESEELLRYFGAICYKQQVTNHPILFSRRDNVIKAFSSILPSCLLIALLCRSLTSPSFSFRPSFISVFFLSLHLLSLLYFCHPDSLYIIIWSFQSYRWHDMQSSREEKHSLCSHGKKRNDKAEKVINSGCWNTGSKSVCMWMWGEGEGEGRVKIWDRDRQWYLLWRI